MAGQFMDMPTRAVLDAQRGIADMGGKLSDLHTLIHQQAQATNHSDLTPYDADGFELQENNTEAEVVTPVKTPVQQAAEQGLHMGAKVAEYLLFPLDVLGGTGICEENSTHLMEHGVLGITSLVLGESMAAIGAGLGAGLGVVVGGILCVFKLPASQEKLKITMLSTIAESSNVAGAFLGGGTAAAIAFAGMAVRGLSGLLKAAIAQTGRLIGGIKGLAQKALDAIKGRVSHRKRQHQAYILLTSTDSQEADEA